VGVWCLVFVVRCLAFVGWYIGPCDLFAFVQQTPLWRTPSNSTL
jgi:hypothetical protein